jgi:hypothetical protein
MCLKQISSLFTTKPHKESLSPTPSPTPRSFALLAVAPDKEEQEERIILSLFFPKESVGKFCRFSPLNLVP